MCRQKELDVDRKSVQKIEFIWQLKSPADEIVADESMFLLMILEKKGTRLKLSQRSVTVL